MRKLSSPLSKVRVQPAPRSPFQSLVTSDLTLTITTVEAIEFVDLTDVINEHLRQHAVENGIVTVFSRHTTAAIRINEHEPELLKDLAKVLDSIAPDDADYFHNDFAVRWVNMTEDESPNGHAHCQHLLLGASEAIPLLDGRLMFGRWQRVFLIELDHARTRDVVVSVMGCGRERAFDPGWVKHGGLQG